VLTLIYSKIGGRLASDGAMEKHLEEAVWLCRQNITSFRAQLTRETIESRRATLAKLLGEEESKLDRLLSQGPDPSSERG
jgi:hypothetical protein